MKHVQSLKKDFEIFIKNHCICDNSFNLNNFSNLSDTINIRNTRLGSIEMSKKKQNKMSLKN